MQFSLSKRWIWTQKTLRNLSDLQLHNLIKSSAFLSNQKKAEASPTFSTLSFTEIEVTDIDLPMKISKYLRQHKIY